MIKIAGQSVLRRHYRSTSSFIGCCNFFPKISIAPKHSPLNVGETPWDYFSPITPTCGCYHRFWPSCQLTDKKSATVKSGLKIFPFISSIKDKHLIGFDLVRAILIHFIIFIHLIAIDIHFRCFCDDHCFCQYQWIWCRRNWWWRLSWRIRWCWLCCWNWSCWNWFCCCWTICIWNNVPITRILIKPAEDCTEIEWLFRWRIHRQF